MRNCSLYRVSNGDGSDPLQVLRDGSSNLQKESVQRRHGRGSTHQNDARMSQRDQAKLHHQMGNGRERKSGQ